MYGPTLWNIWKKKILVLNSPWYRSPWKPVSNLFPKELCKLFKWGWFKVFFNVYSENISQRTRPKCKMGIMVFNAIFNNISGISWRSVLLVEETGVPREKHQPSARHWQILSHNVVLSTPRHEWDTNSPLVVIDTDC